MQDFLISFIIPVYNPNPKLFKDAVESILNQNSNSFEIIIADDGSDDISYLEPYKNRSNVNIIVNNHIGLAHSRNTGIIQAKGTFISFVDCDDLISPSFVSNCRKIVDLNHIDKDIVFFASVSNLDLFYKNNS